MTQLRFINAQQVIDTYPALKELVTVTPFDIEPFDYIRAVLKSDRPEQSLAFCSYLMPKRDAVRWLCQILRMPDHALAPSDEALRQLAEDWVRSPSETARRKAFQAGMADKDRRAAAWAAIAAGWAGGNMSSDEKHPVPPPAHLTAQGVTVALKLLIAAMPQNQQFGKIDEYANMAITLLKGKPE